jgi:hypothetical protein
VPVIGAEEKPCRVPEVSHPRLPAVLGCHSWLQSPRWRFRLIFTIASVRCTRPWVEAGAQREVLAEVVQLTPAVEPTDADDCRENDRSQNVDHLGSSLVHPSARSTGPRSPEPDRGARAMLLRQLRNCHTRTITIRPIGRRAGDGEALEARVRGTSGIGITPWPVLWRSQQAIRRRTGRAVVSTPSTTSIAQRGAGPDQVRVGLHASRCRVAMRESMMRWRARRSTSSGSAPVGVPLRS